MPYAPSPSRRRLLALMCAGLAAAAALHAAPFDPVAETDRLLATVPAAARAKSDAYFEGGYWLLLWGLVESALVAWILLKTRLAFKMRDAAERLVRWGFLGRFFQGVVFLSLYVAAMWVLELPWDWYTGFAREHQYGLSNLSLGGWLGERATGLIPQLVLGVPVAALLYCGIRRLAGRWWVAAGVAMPFVLLLTLLVAPVFIAPLFNKYTPLADPTVREPILSLARANGVPANNVYQFDASKQSDRISANVSGAMGTIRVSLNDNLLKRCTPAEVQAVMGHELGHYVLNHVYKLTIYLSLVYAAAFAFTHWLFGVMHRRFAAGWGVRDISDFAGLPLVVVAFGLFMFLATPVTNSIVRSTETEADIFGLNAARQPDGFATTALKLAQYRKLAPGPWEETIFFDHPSGRSRVLMAMRWKAEHLVELAPAGPAVPTTP